MIYCSAKQKQYRTNMEGCKIQSGATLPNKAVRAEQLLFLYSVWTTIDCKSSNKPVPAVLCGFPKRKHIKYENNCNAFKIFLPSSNCIHVLSVFSQLQPCRHKVQHLCTCTLKHRRYKSAQLRLRAIWRMQSKPLSADVDGKIECTILNAAGLVDADCKSRAELPTLSRSL